MIAYLIEHIDGRLLLIKTNKKFNRSFSSFIKSYYLIKIKRGCSRWITKEELKDYI